MHSLVLDPPTIYDVVDRAAKQKVKAKLLKTAALAIIAGCFISIGMQVSFHITAGTPTPPQLVLGGVFFSTGLLAIVLCGAELFTGNCLMLMAVFEKHITVRDLLKEWGIVYVGNFFGCLLFAAINLGAGINSFGSHRELLTPVGTRLCAVASAKAYLYPHQMFFKGIMANFCVCVAVLMSMSSKAVSGKIFAVVMPIVCFYVIGYEHSVANMYLFSMATITNCEVYHGRYWLNLCLVTLGNIVGASILSAVYWVAYLHQPEEGGSASQPNPQCHQPETSE